MTSDHSHAGHDHHAHGHVHDHVHGPAPVHGHEHAGGHHNHLAHASHRRLAGALIVTVLAMIVAVVGGFMAHSLALVADAGHMLADAGALGLGLFAARQALKPADENNSFGHERMPVLAAFVNGVLLLLASAWIAVEAVQRLISPTAVDGHTMIWVASIGFVANLVAFGLLHGGDAEDLNRRGAAAHVLSDLLGSIAALVAGWVILRYQWLPADPILSMVAASLVLRTGLRVARESAHILLEGTPRGLNLEALADELPGRVPGVRGVHHVHAWSLSQTKKLMTLHVVPEGDISPEIVVRNVRDALMTMGITHVTVQIEAGACAEPDCVAHESHAH